MLLEKLNTTRMLEYNNSIIQEVDDTVHSNNFSHSAVARPPSDQRRPAGYSKAARMAFNENSV